MHMTLCMAVIMQWRLWNIMWYFLPTIPPSLILSALPSQEAQQYAEENGLVVMETSAKTSTNVSDLFMAIGKSLFLWNLIKFLFTITPPFSHLLSSLLSPLTAKKLPKGTFGPQRPSRCSQELYVSSHESHHQYVSPLISLTLSLIDSPPSHHSSFLASITTYSVHSTQAYFLSIVRWYNYIFFTERWQALL